MDAKPIQELNPIAGETFKCVRSSSKCFIIDELYDAVDMGSSLRPYVGIMSESTQCRYTESTFVRASRGDLVADAAARPIPGEGYPDGNPKTAVGMSKPPLRFVPPVAIYTMGQAFADGGVKYGPMNWRDNAVTASVYYDAAMRHLMSWWDGEDSASDSKVHHLGHAMACLAIIVDAEASGKLNDDRATAGTLAAWLKEATDKAA